MTEVYHSKEANTKFSLVVAIWMLPKWNEYGGWPASGEIDIVESRGTIFFIATYLMMGGHITAL